MSRSYLVVLLLLVVAVVLFLLITISIIIIAVENHEALYARRKYSCICVTEIVCFRSICM